MTKKSHSVTIRQVAQKAGVSVATVSRYINQNAPISEKVAKRLEKVMTDLQYVPHAAARTLASRKTHTIGLILMKIHRDFFAPLLSGIEAVVSEHNHIMLVATSEPEKSNGNVAAVGSHNTDGLLIFANSLSDDQIRQLYQKNIPMVLIHRSAPDGLEIPSVTVENKAATRKTIDHLIEVHGRRNIIFMRGPKNQEDSYWREIGYKASLEDHGIPFDERLILQGEFERDIAYKSLKDFLSCENYPPFDAIFSGDDDAAIGALRALDEFGIQTPERVSLVGFDDFRLSPYLNPSLTTVRAPTEDVGRVAAEQLFRLIEGQNVEATTLLPTEIILRRSCGCNL
ncbi:MAG: LacI family DNA-binding transcriptional regulator [Anaerolineales bacterium]